MSTQIRESSSVTNCTTLENDMLSVNAIETIEEEEKKMNWGDLIIEELGREDTLKYHKENPKIKTKIKNFLCDFPILNFDEKNQFFFLSYHETIKNEVISENSGINISNENDENFELIDQNLINKKGKKKKQKKKKGKRKKKERKKIQDYVSFSSDLSCDDNENDLDYIFLKNFSDDSSEENIFIGDKELNKNQNSLKTEDENNNVFLNFFQNPSNENETMFDLKSDPLVLKKLILKKMSFDNKLDVSMIDLLDICIESNIPLTALDKILKVCYSLLLRNPPRTTLYRSEKGLSNYVKNNFDFVKTRIANFIDDEKNLVEHPYIPLNESLRQFLSIDYLRKKLILKPDHGSDPNNKNFSPQQFTSLKNFENKVLNNLEEDEIPICISFFYDHHEVNKKQNVGGFYFFIENLPVWWARRDESIFLISNILEEFNFYSYQHLLNLQKELLSLKRGFIFEKQKYKVFFLKFYSDSKEINQAVGRKDPNAHNQCPYCDQVSIPKKNLQNNEYYSSKIKRHKRNVEEFKENWKKIKNSKNPKEARKIVKILQSVSLLRHKLSTKFKAHKKSQIKAQNSKSSKNKL
ncbi:hypothetical protein M0812_14047 [Anaeramoeba flamelloides]|uniref:Uncharacterized protein n=1 Tax=Anaeramoeba flamelloides TaxID=1746091 RepID=A0AAV7ZK67_9EUKA|nr:hypothetical protein M0812_14047 [Anaeramoeba flamelloides]